MELQFERFTLFCRDLEASLRFYRDALGLLSMEADPLAEELLFGRLAGGGEVVVRELDGSLELDVKPRETAGAV